MNPWPHQIRGVEGVLGAIADGCRRVVLQSPTGGGKSLMMQLLARHYLDDGKQVALYTNRRMLIDQTSETLMAAGVYHGIRAPGYADEREHPFQVCSFQTEHTRSMRAKRTELHDADLVMVDEAHMQTGPKSRDILDAHHAAGAAVVLVSATPFGLGGMADRMVQAGTLSELRECGALVAARTFGPDEPDWKAFRKLREGQDPSERDNRAAIMVPGIFGRVWEWFKRLNPDRRPTLLFAPDVEGSIWFAERFTAAGVNAVHIDGEDVWRDGTFTRTSKRLREQVLEDSKSGKVVVICNRFVLREGIDAPWLSHGIFATRFGLQSYIQSGGRLLRACAGLDHVTIQDHGGNWHLHGSLNADRYWSLDHTAHIASGMRADRLRAKKDPEPFLCPKCKRVWTIGRVCNERQGGCGFVLENRKKSRAVVSTDGTLKELTGDIYRRRRISQAPNGPALWRTMYFRSRSEKGARTFRAAAALFAQENHWGWPNPEWPLMPIEPLDWFRLVADVPTERLTT